jgi:hypothetical protein
LKIKHSGSENPQGMIIVGEAPESDEEREEGEYTYPILLSSDKLQKCREVIVQLWILMSVSELVNLT